MKNDDLAAARGIVWACVAALAIYGVATLTWLLR